MSRYRVFLSHTADMLANYYGPRAVAALEEIAEVAINPTSEHLDPNALAKHAAGCSVIISDRMTPGPASFFDQAPESLVAFLRCAVDIRNVDVDAANRHGILVTQATPGFAASVAELGIGMMVDLARSVSAAVGTYRAGRGACGAHGPPAPGLIGRDHRVWRDRPASGEACHRFRHDGPRLRSL